MAESALEERRHREVTHTNSTSHYITYTYLNDIPPSVVCRNVRRCCCHNARMPYINVYHGTSVHLPKVYMVMLMVAGEVLCR